MNLLFPIKSEKPQSMPPSNLIADHLGNSTEEHISGAALHYVPYRLCNRIKPKNKIQPKQETLVNTVFFEHASNHSLCLVVLKDPILRKEPHHISSRQSLSRVVYVRVQSGPRLEYTKQYIMAHCIRLSLPRHEYGSNS